MWRTEVNRLLLASYTGYNRRDIPYWMRVSAP